MLWGASAFVRNGRSGASAGVELPVEDCKEPHKNITKHEKKDNISYPYLRVAWIMLRCGFCLFCLGIPSRKTHRNPSKNQKENTHKEHFPDGCGGFQGQSDNHSGDHHSYHPKNTWCNQGCKEVLADNCNYRCNEVVHCVVFHIGLLGSAKVQGHHESHIWIIHY